MSISVIINTFNEEANIADCIRSVRELAQEVVVCDMHSTDATVSISESLGARVTMVDPKHNYDFGRLRHFAVMQAKHEWVMVIDADERMTPDLATKLRQVAEENKTDVVYLNVLYWYFGGWVRHGIFFPQLPRFFRRDAYRGRYKDVNEPIHRDLSVLYDIQNRIILPRSYYLLHYAYPTIEKYVDKTLGLHARLEAEQRHKEGQRFSHLRLVGEPMLFFIYSLVRRKGFRDGMRGFILAALFACYRFIAWANLWLLEELDRQKQTLA